MFRKALEKYKRNELMPPGHPIILLKSSQFNMAAVSLKRSIELDAIRAIKSEACANSLFK